MRDLSDIVLKPGDFAALADACKHDPSFPADYDGWCQLIHRAGTQARERGLFPTPLHLVPEAFIAWCKSVEIVPCLDALRAFAILKRGRVGGRPENLEDDYFGSEDGGHHIPKLPPRGAASASISRYM